MFFLMQNIFIDMAAMQNHYKDQNIKTEMQFIVHLHTSMQPYGFNNKLNICTSIVNQFTH